METRKSASPRIISGVIVLMISNIVVKLLGLLCKIPLHDLLQDQGMSYFNIAYNIFTTLYMVSTAGLPTAVTIMISDTPAGSEARCLKYHWCIHYTVWREKYLSESLASF